MADLTAKHLVEHLRTAFNVMKRKRPARFKAKRLRDVVVSERSNAAEVDRPTCRVCLSIDDVAAKVIADCGGDPHAAVTN